MTLLMYIILGAATGIKVRPLSCREYRGQQRATLIIDLWMAPQQVLLYFYCVAYAKRSPSIEALAEDHRSTCIVGRFPMQRTFLVWTPLGYALTLASSLPVGMTSFPTQLPYSLPLSPPGTGGQS
jgi:hypothetical protein